MSSCAGLCVGILYGIFNVRSPAPPIVALVGLLGILVGEQIPPLIRHLHASARLSEVWALQVRPHVFGKLPTGRPAGAPTEGNHT
ncbi:MAG: DUF1427 family protein [Steroidobacteraceae bacterium]